jgi:hypothetical protein
MDVDAKLLKITDKLVQSLNGLKVDKGENELFVTDLSTCQIKKRYFEEKANEGVIGHALRGSIVHDFIERFFSSRGFRTEVPVEMDFGDFILRGRVDVIVDGYPLEIKSSKYSLYEYFLQVMIYAYMLGVDHGYVLIVDDKVYLYKIYLDGNLVDMMTGKSYQTPIVINGDIIREFYKLYKRGKLYGQGFQCVTCYLNKVCTVPYSGVPK